LPSQQQLRWSELRVGVTVIFASLVLALLIFLMSGTGGPFGKKLIFRTYFGSANGLRVGAPVALEGVTIGNVRSIRIVGDPKRHEKPVEVVLRVDPRFNFRIRKDSLAELTAAGVLGDLYVDINSTAARGPEAADNDELETRESTTIEDTVKAGQTTLQNMDVLLRRMDRILQTVESGEGTVGKFIKDPTMYNRTNALIGQMQGIVNDVNAGKGSVGKLLRDEELYTKLNVTVEKANKLITDIESGKGSAGKFLKDEALYKNANETIAKANKLMDDVNAGRGALGKFASDQEFARKIDVMITKLSEISAGLEAGQGTGGRLLKDPSLYGNADQMLVETRSLVKAIRENPKKYLTIHFKLF
jgi:phospholipid/cholesterol/gamma-HCH transport system substrate-binding protein